MKNISRPLAIIAILSLLGAGCGSKSVAIPTNPTPPSPAPTVPTPPPTAPTTTPPMATSTPPETVPVTTSTATVPPIDATWGTYTTRNGFFSFQYPTKGRLAPTWEQKYLSSTDPNLKDGCYVVQGELPTQTQTKQTPSGLSYCQAISTEGAAGSSYRTDNLVFVNGNNNIILLTLVKRYLNDPTIQAGCEPGGKLVQTTYCQPFDQNVYQAEVEQIANTVVIK